MSAPRANVYHAHLDVCEQCREHPWKLCADGARLLSEAVTDSSRARDEAGASIGDHLANGDVDAAYAAAKRWAGS